MGIATGTLKADEIKEGVLSSDLIKGISLPNKFSEIIEQVTCGETEKAKALLKDQYEIYSNQVAFKMDIQEFIALYVLIQLEEED